ncbi:ribosome-associated translation inhibitor RaiA [Dysgonomonas sp. 216]|uniref:ribosome hibernation-promoting factor, HPF/YfiA family n=1 Tax=Dysgonomonas sp. 216 TaxID=2302934 RepID=UPI0013D20269|nr:ribosome-associated translation inhibitor RaiA [Dysgonomonas sp. 216]NDW17391.1 ribosome-associated translation inhibitor RaiA [Dysgonomonas sp. 216]
MEIRIQALHFDAAERLRSFIEKKVSKLEKYSDGITDAEVILKVIKPEVANNKEASVRLNVKNGEFFANKVADSFEEAVDLSVEALEKQLVKFKEKSQAK